MGKEKFLRWEMIPMDSVVRQNPIGIHVLPTQKKESHIR